MKNIKFILTVLLLIGLYALFLVGFKIYNNTENEAPVISIQDEILTVSVKDKENALLQGVSASDSEDGDLTSKIVIDSISEFNTLFSSGIRELNRSIRSFNLTLRNR